eukprot:5007572-Amphidinium_carterae.2
MATTGASLLAMTVNEDELSIKNSSDTLSCKRNSCTCSVSGEQGRHMVSASASAQVSTCTRASLCSWNVLTLACYQTTPN